jgi:pimeloyl-ACP methyl ester carboxylesterase
VPAVSNLLDVLVLVVLTVVVPLVAFLIYVTMHYGPFINRIFEERPMLMPLRVSPEDLGEPVSFSTVDGLRLSGTYLARRGPGRVGVLVFCHEYLSDRWSYLPYLDRLRDQGYDIFTFDFRNHGASESGPGYEPMQWVTDFEVLDLRAALDYLRSRPDHDSAGFGLFGVSRGGSAALVVGAAERDVWGVVTDGAFPTRGTMTAYILRWAEIYVKSALFLAVVPRWVYAFVGNVSRLRSARRLNCRFPDIETSASRLAPRPWLMIHGQRDAYIGPDIARGLFAHARDPKEMWLVPDAKHNRCRECHPEAYRARLVDFLRRYAPRCPVEAAPEPLATAASRPRFADEPDFAIEPGFAIEPVELIAASVTS